MVKKSVEKTLALIATIILFFGFNGAIGYIETHYTRKATVCEVNAEMVTFKDWCGLEWKWENEDGQSFEIGQNVKLSMDNNCTETYVYDDIIVRVR